MKKRLLGVRLAAFVLATMLMGSSVSVYADEVSEEENVEAEAGEENAEAAEEESGAGELIMSSITASNGKTIAQVIPDDMIPAGFHKTSVQYSGTNVDVGYMDSDEYGEVVVAYLANPDGSDGSFYLCDINTAEMTDFVKITNGEGKFIVVLNPGDNVVAPAGFIKATLDWHGKNVTAWALPKENSSDDKASLDTPVELYALDITAGADGDAEDAAESEEPAEEASEDKEDEKDDKEASKAVAEPEDGSRVEYAPSSDFFLIYAIDQDGKVGFYMYDIVGETFQRYVEIANGDSDLLSQYRKQAKTRLIIIVVLAVLLAAAIVVVINLALRSGGSNKKSSRSRYNRFDDEDDEDEEDDDEGEEIEQMRRRVAKKERRHIKQGRRELNYLMDIDDDDEDEEDDEDEDDDDFYEESRPRRGTRGSRRPAPARERRQSSSRREALVEDEDDDDDEVFEAPIRRRSSASSASAYDEQPARRQSAATKAPRGGISIEPDSDDDFDDDFEFEFLDLK